MHGSITYSVHTLNYAVRFSDRRTMAISVYPDRSIEIIAPRGTPQHEAEARLRRRARWVIRQLLHFEQYRPRSPARRYVGGETHLYLGRQYRLKLIRAGAEAVKLKGAYLFVACPERANPRVVKRLVSAWYREKSRSRITERYHTIRSRFAHLGPMPPRPILRTMPRRWGSFSRHGSISLHPDLIRAPTVCIDYVIAHELLHLIHPNHGPAFYELLGTLMPDWQARKQRLERVML